MAALKNLIKSVTQRLKKAVDNGRASSLEGALARHRHIPVQSVVDIGASDGCWSKRAMKYFPRAHYLLIEAQKQAHEESLKRFKEQRENVDYLLAAAGHRQGTIYFDASDPLGGQASEQPFAANNVAVPVTTIDLEVARRRLPAPFLLKLDTHGFEVPIFQGATQTLTQANLIVVEVYNFKLIDGCLRFHEMCAYLEERGFHCLDIFDIMHRPRDHALWQMDMMFAPATRPEFQCHYYQ